MLMQTLEVLHAVIRCAQVAEHNAQAARQRADAMRKEVNPLNHPIVQRYLQQK